MATIGAPNQKPVSNAKSSQYMSQFNTGKSWATGRQHPTDKNPYPTTKGAIGK